jgi:hypothetical protein
VNGSTLRLGAALAVFALAAGPARVEARKRGRPAWVRRFSAGPCPLRGHEQKLCAVGTSATRSPALGKTAAAASARTALVFAIRARVASARGTAGLEQGSSATLENTAILATYHDRRAGTWYALAMFDPEASRIDGKTLAELLAAPAGRGAGR